MQDLENKDQEINTPEKDESQENQEPKEVKKETKGDDSSSNKDEITMGSLKRDNKKLSKENEDLSEQLKTLGESVEKLKSKTEKIDKWEESKKTEELNAKLDKNFDDLVKQYPEIGNRVTKDAILAMMISDEKLNMAEALEKIIPNFAQDFKLPSAEGNEEAETPKYDHQALSKEPIETLSIEQIEFMLEKNPVGTKNALIDARLRKQLSKKVINKFFESEEDYKKTYDELEEKRRGNK